MYKLKIIKIHMTTVLYASQKYIYRFFFQYCITSKNSYIFENVFHINFESSILGKGFVNRPAWFSFVLAYFKLLFLSTKFLWKWYLTSVWLILLFLIKGLEKFISAWLFQIPEYYLWQYIVLGKSSSILLTLKFI